MCGGPDSLKRRPAGDVGVGVDDSVEKKQGSSLLELSAADDLAGFRRAVEEGGLGVDLASPWYGRWGGRMGFEQRTPLMIAAMYGSTAVIEFILATGAADVNRACGSDGATALHCAAAGGSPACLDAARMLVDASADVDAVDAAGNRPGDVLPRKPAPSGSPKLRSLEVLLKAAAAAHGAGGSVAKEGSPSKPGEKKEYPADLTLPDIKNGVYGTDEFRMYTFKVKPCSRAYSHDWTECPFAHPGENARRRDPRKYPYSCVPCPEFRKGACRNGDACDYAHGVFECWLHPSQYRTRLCKDETGCARRVCFFAHKPEELRAPTSPSSGSALPSSPRSTHALPPLDVAAASLLLGQPMSPAASSPMAPASLWLNQAAGGIMTPTRQIPGSRLKSSLRSRNADLDVDLMGLDVYQKQLMEEIAGLSSPTSWKSSLAGAAGASRGSDYGDLLGSLDPSSPLLSQLQGLSLRQSAASATGAAQFQSPSGIQMHQSMGQQLLSGYSGSSSSSSIPSSPSLRASSSSFGIDHSLATAIMNSRASAFAKRSQSFCDRGTMSRLSGLGTATTAASAATAATLCDWGSPDGKLDWGIQGEELNKLRKSASFRFRSHADGSVGATAAASTEEPDVSWVQSLVKDGPPLAVRPRAEQQQKPRRATDVLSPWAEQLYIEQEQMVA